MIIRQAEVNDVADISPLFDQYRVFYGKTSDEKQAQQFLSDRLKNNQSVIFVAQTTDTKQIVAFMQLYPLFSSTRMKRLWLLNDIFVLPTHRSLGISKLLLERCKQYCIETSACGFMLETQKSNTIGNNLYAAVGMSLDNEHNYYSWDV